MILENMCLCIMWVKQYIVLKKKWTHIVLTITPRFKFMTFFNIGNLNDMLRVRKYFFKLGGIEKGGWNQILCIWFPLKM